MNIHIYLIDSTMYQDHSAPLIKNFYLILGIFLVGFFFLSWFHQLPPKVVTGAPPYGAPESEAADSDPYSLIKNWQRPDGPAKVAIQVGHWKNQEVPDELENLKRNTGASGGGKSEWEVNYAIAVEMKKRLEPEGVEVEILPATVPPRYWADVFMAIHADGSTDTTTTGYKIAPPWRDFTGNAQELTTILEEKYGATTQLTKDPNITRNMRGYYAFSWWRYDHAIHPMTTAVIVETGFLTNPNDRKIIVDQPELSAQALADGLLEYLRIKNLLS